ncbi:hypothetical protein LCGC14_0540610 [marine sediment metagenome]|uniref:Uncharacterized protein n=1 Tax=marine sediment metagenome TaxID=412755 RepID=A0A0F9V164_9ZZZZ
MLLLSRNHELIKDRERTFLTADVDVGATSLTVKAVDSNAWADNDFVIVGEIGVGNAEILQINGAVTDGTSLIVDNAGSGGSRYTHSINEPVYRIDYNQMEFNRSATDATSGVSVLGGGAKEIQPDDLFTRFEDTANTTGFGFIRFKNSLTSAFSSYSDGIPYTGYGPLALGRIIRGIRRQLSESTVDIEHITDEDIIEETNEKQRDVAHDGGRLWPFYETIRSASTVSNQRRYTIDDNVEIGKAYTITVDSQPMAKIDQDRFNILNWDNLRTEDPTHVGIWNNRIVLWPLPSASASSDTLDGDITASATTIMLDDVSDFRAPGRVLIGSEVISYENLLTKTTLDGALTAAATTVTVDDTSAFPSAGTIVIDDEEMTYTGTGSTTFTGVTRGANSTSAVTHTDNATVTSRTLVGCERGLEGTTAATASDGDAVTERDIIYNAHEEPAELKDPNDQTAIPDPKVLIYGVSMELALTKLNDQLLSDRLKIRYDEALERLRDKFGKKFTAPFGTIKNKEEVVTDTGRLVNPQDFPTNLGT